jgi:PTS system cellobiose-specific IIC component
MPSFLERLEQPFMHIASKLGQQPHLNAIRDGVVGALPLVLIGSLFMLAAQPPLPQNAWFDAYAKIAVFGHPLVPALKQGFLALVALIGIYVAFGVAHSLARRYELDALSAALLAAAALLLINGVPLATPAGAAAAERMLPATNLGAGGLFMALLLGLLVPEVLRLAKRRRWEITMPAGVPPAVGRSFSALIPGLLVLVPLWAVVHLGGVNLFALITKYLSAPLAALDTNHAAVVVIMVAIIVVDSLLWLLGVHAVAILAPLSAVWLANIGQNGADVLAGHAPTMFNTRETLQFFIWLGGSGATIALPLLLLRAKSASLRAIARVGAVPALFNINEPIIFGVPVMMNATLALPFLLAPLACLGTTLLFVHAGWVPLPHLVVPWTLPGPIGAFLATGGAWQAAVLSLINLVLVTAIYTPFVRALDRRIAAQEAE